MPSKQEPLRERIVTNYAKKVIDFLNEEKLIMCRNTETPQMFPNVGRLRIFLLI
jgi:hypothetical protein